jgi:hypothetical protein
MNNYDGWWFCGNCGQWYQGSHGCYNTGMITICNPYHFERQQETYVTYYRSDPKIIELLEEILSILKGEDNVKEDVGEKGETT